MKDGVIKTLIVLVGPTGVGKTAISIKLAQLLACPIVSADSRQFFKELKIGTAAPTSDELSRAKHHFIGNLSIHDKYSAGEYEEDAITLLNNLFTKHNNIILCGGSMLYIDAVCKGLDDIPQIEEEIRKKWKNEYLNRGLEFIQNRLKELDPIHYNEVDIKNPKRVLHALEICTQTGKTFTELRTGRKKNRDFKIVKIGLNRDREELYTKINLRVEKMVKNGLIEEVKNLYKFKHLNTLNTVGYKELFAHWDGEYDFNTAIEKIKQNSRRYAKRQLTWFRKDEKIQWFLPENKTEIIKYINNRIDAENRT